MSIIAHTWVLIAAAVTVLLSATPVFAADARARLYARLEAYLDARAEEFDQIDPARRAQLDELAAYVRDAAGSDRPARLTFVCTHNSRRSHLAQLWAGAAAARLGIEARTYSGGTEATAFNPRAVAAVKRAGFKVEKTSDDPNPIYHVRLSDDAPAMTCFSKPYDNAPNPTSGFAAVMVCNDADEACPVVRGAERRAAIPYVDPKISDSTPEEAATYDARCAQIAREMLYMMTRAAG